MDVTWRIRALVLLAALPASAAWGYGAPIRVGIPASGLSADVSTPPDSRQAPVKIEVAVSSWAPSNLELASRVPTVSSCKMRGLPSFSAQLIVAPWGLLEGADLNLKLGGGFTSLTRVGEVPSVGGAPLAADQRVILVPLIAGLELSPLFAQWKYASLHVGAALEPTLLLSQRSAFDDGQTGGGLPVAFSAGIESNLGGWLGRTPFSVNAEVVQTLGSVEGGSLRGMGLSLGVRAEM